MIDTKALRSRILDLAIQGKLTQQLETDDSIDELFLRIKVKKRTSNISNIPSNWLFAQISDLCSINTGTSISKKVKEEKYNGCSEGYPYIATKDVGFDCSIDYNNGVRIPFNEPNFVIAEKDSVLLCIEGGSAGRKISIVNQDVCYGNKLCKFYTSVIIPKYVFYFLQCNEFKSNFKDSITGLIGGVNIGKIRKVIIPVPPLAEQKRIVERVEEIFRLLDTVDKAQEKYSADTEILKAKLITAGIQGKLTQQLPSDGTAEELYQQIQAEKQKLISEGKIKKEKPLPPIKPEDIPFEVPENWKWVRLESVCRSIMDGDHQPPPQTTEGMPFIVISNLSNGSLDFSNTRHVSQEYFDSLSNERIAEHGDILFTVTGSFGIPIKVETSQQFCFQRHIALLKPITQIFNDYLLHVLKSDFLYKQCDAVALGVAQRTVGIKSLRNFLIPLPPLAEQKRIADVLERALGAIDKG